ncbi:MAG: hypothetical protein ACFFAL_00065 [Promethearchaeota archaeon]
MVDRVDLRTLERKAYLTYHQDGIVDIFIGLAIITFGVLFLPWFIESSGSAFAVIFILWIGSYASVKRAITVPRIGYVEFKTRRQSRVIALALLLVVINVILFLITTLDLLAPELRTFLNTYGVTLIAFIVGGLFILCGYLVEIQRFIGYGVVALVVFLINQFFPMHLSIPIVVLGVVIAAFGFVLLYQFLRKYPKAKREFEFDDPWEEDPEANEGGKVH